MSAQLRPNSAQIVLEFEFMLARCRRTCPTHLVTGWPGFQRFPLRARGCATTGAAGVILCDRADVEGPEPCRDPQHRLGRRTPPLAVVFAETRVSRARFGARKFPAAPSNSGCSRKNRRRWRQFSPSVARPNRFRRRHRYRSGADARSRWRPLGTSLRNGMAKARGLAQRWVPPASLPHSLRRAPPVPPRVRAYSSLERPLRGRHSQWHPQTPASSQHLAPVAPVFAQLREPTSGRNSERPSPQAPARPPPLRFVIGRLWITRNTAFLGSDLPTAAEEPPPCCCPSWRPGAEELAGSRTCWPPGPRGSLHLGRRSRPLLQDPGAPHAWPLLAGPGCRSRHRSPAYSGWTTAAPTGALLGPRSPPAHGCPAQSQIFDHTVELPGRAAEAAPNLPTTCSTVPLRRTRLWTDAPEVLEVLQDCLGHSLEQFPPVGR